jgi:hypothetical protein
MLNKVYGQTSVLDYGRQAKVNCGDIEERKVTLLLRTVGRWDAEKSVSYADWLWSPALYSIEAVCLRKGPPWSVHSC